MFCMCRCRAVTFLVFTPNITNEHISDTRNAEQIYLEIRVVLYYLAELLR